MKFGLALGLVCAAHVACAVPTADAPTTDGTALVGLGKSSSSPAAALQRYVDSGEIAGAVSMVAVSGKVETAYVGLADPTTGRPFDGKTLFWIASMTKGFCGAAVMSCVDKGLLSLDDPVEKYIPEIADVQVEEKGPDGKTVRRPPKTKMTIRMCLSHVAGYPFSTPLELERGALNLSMAEHVKGAVECPLLRDPLTAHQYSNVDINLAGRVVEIVTGMAFEDYLQKTFFDPLGMKDITFYPTAEQLSRKVYVARVANGRRYEDGRGDQWAKMLDHREIRRGREHAIAAGGLYSTPADVMKFYLMLANDGKAPDGTRILSHASILELSRAQYPHLDRYSLGLRQFGDWFGHDGALQTEAYANWKENRAALLFVQVTGSWDHRFKLDWRASAMAPAAGRKTPDDGITRVLIIGNSFSACVMDHLPPVAADRGVKLDVCSLFIGGCSLARHWKNACLDGTPDEPKPYLLTRDTCGKGETNHINVCTALRMEDWDIVTVQQASGDSWRAETYGPEGDRLVAKIRELAPHAKVYVQETWSYTPWDKRLKKWGITPDEMYAKLHAAYAAFARRNGLDIIPFGAAVQEWRRRLPVRYTANSFGGDVIGEDVLPADTLFKRNAKGEWVINCDAFHTGQRGNYFQGLVWAATLLGVDPEAVGYRPDFVTESDGRLMKRIAKELMKE